MIILNIFTTIIHVFLKGHCKFLTPPPQTSPMVQTLPTVVHSCKTSRDCDFFNALNCCRLNGHGALLSKHRNLNWELPFGIGKHYLRIFINILMELFLQLLFVCYHVLCDLLLQQTCTVFCLFVCFAKLSMSKYFAFRVGNQIVGGCSARRPKKGEVCDPESKSCTCEPGKFSMHLLPT